MNDAFDRNFKNMTKFSEEEWEVAHFEEQLGTVEES
jgi:hypothetical protein